MAKYMDLQKTVDTTDETFDVGSIINQALIEILISNQITTEEELVKIIGKINRQHEIYFEQQTRPYE